MGDVNTRRTYLEQEKGFQCLCDRCCSELDVLPSLTYAFFWRSVGDAWRLRLLFYHLGSAKNAEVLFKQGTPKATVVLQQISKSFEIKALATVQVPLFQEEGNTVLPKVTFSRPKRTLSVEFLS